MTYNEITKEADEILNGVSSMSIDVLEDTLDRIDELNDFLENLSEKDDSDDDTEYQEAAEILEEARYAVEAEMDAADDFDTEDDYY
jgi:aspartyl/asparaginyl-tRNA synthetase